jgi:hypothetical protein
MKKPNYANTVKLEWFIYTDDLNEKMVKERISLYLKEKKALCKRKVN